MTGTEEQQINRFRGMDQNGDGVITRDEWRGSDQSFRQQDWNRDGVLSGAEVRSDAQRAGRLDEELDFDYLDTNNDNRIELNEWRGSDDQFTWLDRNRNGVLTRAEMAGAAATSTAAPRTGAFGRLDNDGDGLISRNEWQGSRAQFNSRDANGDGVLTRREYAATGDFGGGALNREIEVPSTQQWTDTGITVRAGDVIRITANGVIQLSDNPNDRANPQGANRRAPNAPVLDAPAGGLLVRIGSSAPMFVGANGTVPRAPTSGRLYLGINDDHMADNTGQFRVTVDVAR